MGSASRIATAALVTAESGERKRRTGKKMCTPTRDDADQNREELKKVINIYGSRQTRERELKERKQKESRTKDGKGD